MAIRQVLIVNCADIEPLSIDPMLECGQQECGAVQMLDSLACIIGFPKQRLTLGQPDSIIKWTSTRRNIRRKKEEVEMIPHSVMTTADQWET